jgi:hypothetical protein
MVIVVPPSLSERENACQVLLGVAFAVTKDAGVLDPWWFLLNEYAGGTSLAVYLRFTTCDGFRRPKSSLLTFLSMTKISTAVNGKDAFRPVFMRVRATFEGHSLQSKQPTRLLINASDRAVPRRWIREAVPSTPYKKYLGNRETLASDRFPMGNTPLFSYI